MKPKTLSELYDQIILKPFHKIDETWLIFDPAENAERPIVELGLDLKSEIRVYFSEGQYRPFPGDTPVWRQGTLSPKDRSERARMGGLAAQQSGRAHRFTSDEARAAGLKGGKIISADREHMREIGKRGGSAPRRNGK